MNVTIERPSDTTPAAIAAMPTQKAAFAVDRSGAQPAHAARRRTCIAISTAAMPPARETGPQQQVSTRLTMAITSAHVAS